MTIVYIIAAWVVFLALYVFFAKLTSGETPKG